MSSNILQEYNCSVRHLATVVLWLSGDPVPHYLHKRMFLVVRVYSICVLLYQIFIALFHLVSDYTYYCCSYVGDSSMLLRIIYPHLIELNALIYQSIFLLKASKIKRFLNELDRVIPHKSTSIGYRKGLLTSLFLAIFALFLLLITRISACGILESYYRSYNQPKIYCDVIYTIPRGFWDKTIFTAPYNKIILQVISMWFSILGVAFTEFWIGNILHTLATAFEESHDDLIPILKEQLMKRESRLQLTSQHLQRSQTPSFGKGFQIWRKQHYQLRLAAKRADSVLSPFSIIHTIFTPLLLCLAGYQMLQKNQEPFMQLFAIKSVVYYLICLSLVRMWVICNAGEHLASQSARLAAKLVKAQVTGLPRSIQFQIRLLASISPTASTACQFFTLTRSFFLTMIGTTFTCLVVFLQVKTNPNKFADHYNFTRTSEC